MSRGNRLRKDNNTAETRTQDATLLDTLVPPVAKFKKEAEPEKLTKFYHKERRRRIFGFFILLLSVIVLFAQCSFFFLWTEDFDKVQWNAVDFLFTDISVSNVMGRIGVWLAYYTVYVGFGLAALFIPWSLFLWGAHLFFKNFKGFFFARIATYGVWMLFFSLVLAFVFSSADFLYGGYVGFLLAKWLSNFLGSVGLALLLVGVVLAYVIYVMNLTINYQGLKDGVRSLWKPSETEFPPTPQGVPSPASEEGTQATTLDETAPESTSSEEEDPPIATTPKNQLAADYVFQKIELSAQEHAHIPNPDVLDMVVLEQKLEALQQEEQEGQGQEGEMQSASNHYPLEVAHTATASPPVQKAQTPSPALSAPNVEFDIAPVVTEEETMLPEQEPIVETEHYTLPSTALLNHYPADDVAVDQQELEANKQQIIQTLHNFKIAIRKISATVGPTVTLYEVIPDEGVRISKIKNLEDDIALSLSALGIRIIAPIPGKGAIGIEVPNRHKKMVSLRTLLRSAHFQDNQQLILPVALGKAIDNTDYVVDLAKMPHLLMAGATGQGKSVGLNVMLMSLLFKKTPQDLKVVLIDPKKVELSLFQKLEHHFLAKLPGEEEAIITDTKKVIHVLHSLCLEMDNRYDLLKDAGAKNIEEYNKKIREKRHTLSEEHKHLPYIVIVIDEFADLIMTAGKEVEMPIARIAQLARAVGLHLVIATQRPSVNIITGMIKANFPARVAFKVSSKVDSRTILDQGGADQLVGKGDMLVSFGGTPVRLQCAFVDTQEVENVCEFISQQPIPEEPYFLPAVDAEEDSTQADATMEDRDALFEEVARLVVSAQSGSTSLIQRKMKLGFNRAGRLMDQLETVGIVSPARGGKPRDVLVKTEMELDTILRNLD